MKQGNELIKPNKKPKVFIYMDGDFPEGIDNVFISSVYKNVKEFEKENEGMVAIVSYDAEHLITTLQKQLDEFKK